MSILQACILGAGGAAAVGMAIYWAVVAWHVLASRAIPRADAGLNMQAPANLPRICILVPAHNEESVIAIVARSLKAVEYPALKVVFCLDRCTDGTSRVLEETLAGDDRCEILVNHECPPDWAGKVHVLWRGVRDSTNARDAEILIFADADTELHPGCVRACLGLLTNRRLDMLSLLSTLTVTTWFEQIVQPAATMELIRQYPIRRANSPTHRRPFANGQFMMFTRAAYERVGGHEAVKDALLEDIALARRCHWAGLSGGLFVAGDMLKCRMYPHWQAFQKGWKRIFTESANRRESRLRAAAAKVVVPGAVLPVLCIAGLGASFVVGGPWGAAVGAACGLALMLAMGALTIMIRTQRGCWWLAPLFPLGAVLTAHILRQAANDLKRNEPTVWAGKAYSRTRADAANDVTVR